MYRGFHPRLFKWKPCGLLQRQVDGLQESDLRANEDGRLLYDATVSVDDREYAIRTDNDGSLIRVDYKGQAAEERALAVEDVSAWPDHPRLDDGRLAGVFPKADAGKIEQFRVGR